MRKQHTEILTLFIFALFLSACTTFNDQENSGEMNDSQIDVHTETREYEEGDTVLEGYLARPRDMESPAPGILICHEWEGLSDYERGRARQLAREGYVVFSADIYGKDNRPESHEEAAEMSGRFRENRDLFRRRVRAGLKELADMEQTDADRLAAIGYCFGGTAVLELARDGADISGVVSLHGGLGTPNPEQAGNIQTSVLVLHGASDPHVSMDEVNNFIGRMKEHEVEDWQVVIYGNTYHSFTNPASGTDPSGGSAYNEQSARRAWDDMISFFDEIFS